MIRTIPRSTREGRFGRSSRYVGRGCDGRFGDAHDSFVRTNGTEADAKARGPGLPTLRSNCAATSRAMTGARKPGSRGERAISVKTIAQGMPDDSAEPVVSAASFSFCWRAMGCGQHPAFPAPSHLRGSKTDAKLGHIMPRECGNLAQAIRIILNCHHPRKRVIQYAAAHRLKHRPLWNTGSPGQAGR